MEVFESTTLLELSHPMARQGTWIDRFPRWLTAREIPGSSGSPMGPRERLFIVAALVVIAVWGFSGSWEFPKVETPRPRARVSALVKSQDRARTAVPTGEAAAGAALFEANGCYACHSVDGQSKIGPNLKGIFGTTAELDDGTTVLVDDEYLVESILHPGARLVAGYESAAMPSFEGLVSEEDARALGEYIKSLE